MEISFSILGSASGVASVERNDSGYILECEGKTALFDCGGGVRSAFLRRGYEPGLLDAVFISHMHPDHISDLPLFIQMLYHSDRIEPLNIYLPDEAVRPVKKYLHSCYLLDEKMPFKFNLKPILKAVRIFDKKAKVTPYANQHLATPDNIDIIEASYYPNKMQCYSFLIQINDKRLFYSADIAALEEIENYLDDLDLLVIETTHVDFRRLPAIIRAKRIKKTLLTHIGDDMLESIHQFADSKAAEYGLIAGGDNLTIKV